jgi:Immunity protein 27
VTAFEDLAPDEDDLRGSWVEVGAQVQADPVCDRVQWLVTSRLQRVATDPSGWNTLYRDPRDGRLWELTYQRSEMHGGGPPTLTVVTKDEARRRYGVATG